MESELEGLKELIERADYQRLREKVKAIHPHDLAELLEQLKPEERNRTLVNLEHAVVIDLLPELPEEMQLEYVKVLPPKQAAELLASVPPDDMTDVLGDLSLETRRKIVDYFTKEKTKEARDLLKHREDTAGGLMTTQVMALPSDLTCAEAEDNIRDKAKEYETVYYIYVLEGQKLVGVLSLRELVLADPTTKLRDAMSPEVIKVLPSLDQEEVARIIADYDLLAIPVVDPKDRLLGIVTVDDVIDVIDEETTEDLAHFSGTPVQMDKLIDAPIFTVVKARLPWLLVTLVGGLLAGTIIGLFKETIATIITLAVFIPIIMDMGGNVGAQSSTIFIRGIATKEVGDIMDYFLREIKIGILMGLATGIGVGIAAFLWQKTLMLGVVVGAAMFFAVSVASTMGVLAPTLFTHLKLDPAITAGPLITTATDITGLIIYFSLATMLLHYLV
ncbi:MAG: magnesium transporter [Candidatus Hydrothermarchaeales archaeon]